MNWQTTMIPGFSPDNKPILSVLAKKTYIICPNKIAPTPKQPPLNTSEIYVDPADPLNCEILEESDLVPYKQNTDIVVLSNAYSPKGKKAFYLDCEVQIGPVQKKIRVFGERHVKSGLIRGVQFTDPIPYQQKELGWSNAYGGIAKSKDGICLPYPPNPLGKGFYLKGRFENYSEILVPSLEDPERPLQPHELFVRKFDDWKKAPKPVNFGWTKPGFFPRFSFAATTPPSCHSPDGSDKTNLPPQVLDFCFFQGAAEGLCNHLLLGDEHVKLIYMDPQKPVFEFDLPNEKPVITLIINNSPVELAPVLQTLLINKENCSLFLVWRASIQYNLKLLAESGLPQFQVI